MLKLLKFSQMLSTHCRPIHLNDTNKLRTWHRVIVRQFYNNNLDLSKRDDSHSNDQNAAPDVTPTIASKFERFSDDKATIILDIEEERDKMLAGEIEEIEDTTPSIFDGLNIERGKTGVFDIEDLVAVLKRDNAENIFVCTVPMELKYVDYLCVITAKSPRHMKSIAEFVRKLFKLKHGKRDVLPKIEGKNSEEWMAMDLGNIALHIFSAKTRKQYDIEMLWSVGADYDTETNKPADPILELFDQHTLTFDGTFPKQKATNIGSSENTVHVDSEFHQKKHISATDLDRNQ